MAAETFRAKSDLPSARGGRGDGAEDEDEAAAPTVAMGRRPDVVVAVVESPRTWGATEEESRAAALAASFRVALKDIMCGEGVGVVGWRRGREGNKGRLKRSSFVTK